jgi:glutaconate CoA-transferase, subunit B
MCKNLMEPCKPIEQMIVTAARLIKNHNILMVGTQWPIVVSLLAKSLHAPDCMICFEGGVVLAEVPERLPLFTGDPVINSSSIFLGGSFQTLGMVLHGGRADLGLLSAASVDRYGNINTTCIGDYNAPKVRFGGSGGACDFGSLVKKLIIILEHDKRRFPERVDFITTPGYLNGGKGRLETGLKPGTGPYAVVTTLGLFHFNEEGEMFLAAYHPRSSVTEVKKNMQWDLKVADSVKALEPPSRKELESLRNRVDPQGMFLQEARLLKGKEIIL